MEIVLENPPILLFLLLIPVLVILHNYFFEHNKKRAMKFSNFSAMKRVTGTHLITKNITQLVIRVTIFTLIILSAAQPVIWYNGKASSTDYVIAIDSSASMISDDVQPDRLTVAKQAAKVFIDRLNTQTKIGLITFSGVTFIKTPLTTDMIKVKQELNNIEIELAGGTDIGSALVTSANILSSADKAKSIILITDGSDTAGSFVEEGLDTATEYVAKNHIKVHTIGIGTGLTNAGYIGETNLRATHDKGSLQELSERTNGNYYEVKNTADIATAFLDIEESSEDSYLSFDVGFILLTISFILLFVEWGLLNTRFRALP